MLKSTFLKQIGDYSATLADVVRNAVESYPAVYQSTTDVHSKRTQANLVHDHMVRSAMERLPSSAFKFIRARQRNLFSFRDKFLIQFKKLNRNLRSSNYPTRQAELFDQLGGVEGLPGMEVNIPLLTVGYVARPFLSGIEGIFVTQTKDHSPLWIHRLDDEEDQQAQIISILKPTTPSTHVRKTRIRRTNTGGDSIELSS